MPSKPGSSPRASEHARKSSAKIRICPFCRKPTLRVADSISGWMTADMFKCDTCGYRGPVFIEVDPDDLEKARQASPTEEEEQEK